MKNTKCFVDSKIFAFIEHWTNEDALFAAKIASNVIGKYSLPCEEKISFVLEAVFELYRKTQNTLFPEEINFYIRTKIKDHIFAEKRFSEKHRKFAEHYFSNGTFEIVHQYEEAIEISKSILSMSEFELFESWLYGERLTGAQRTRISRLLKKIREAYDY